MEKLRSSARNKINEEIVENHTTINKLADKTNGQASRKKNIKRCQLEEAKDVLHTSTIPEVLLNRENECDLIRRFILNAIKPHSDAFSRVLCISGVPGTGKTASVLMVIKDLKNKKNVSKFNSTCINGLELSDPKELFVKVYKTVNKGIIGANKKISPRDAQHFLNDYFTNEENKRHKPALILIDEIDMLYTKREEVIYTLFNWTTMANSRCCVIAISNTLDLAERKFSQRVVSRMGSNKLTFQPYEFDQIEAIFKHRIKGINAISDKTIELTSKKIASVSGDLRKAFELMRRAIDLALEKYESDGKARESATLLPEHILNAIQESTTSIRMEFIQSLSKHEELLFRALVLNLHESALEDTDFSKVLFIYKKLCTSENIRPLSLSAAFHHLQELSDCHLIIISSENGQLHCQVKLGFPISEAQFCIRQLDKQKNNLATPTGSATKSASKSPRARKRSPSSLSSKSNAGPTSRRVSRKIEFTPQDD